jgi:hypothetical protein
MLAEEIERLLKLLQESPREYMKNTAGNCNTE